MHCCRRSLWITLPNVPCLAPQRGCHPWLNGWHNNGCCQNPTIPPSHLCDKIAGSVCQSRIGARPGAERRFGTVPATANDSCHCRNNKCARAQLSETVVSVNDNMPKRRTTRERLHFPRYGARGAFVNDEAFRAGGLFRPRDKSMFVWL